MRLHDLKPSPGSRISATRVGRGIGSGKGKLPVEGRKGKGALRRRRSAGIRGRTDAVIPAPAQARF